MITQIENFNDSKKQKDLYNYIKQKEADFESIVDFIKNPSLKEYKKHLHSVDLEYENLVEKDQNLIPVNNKYGENSFYCAISIILFGDESKFNWFKVGILYTLIQSQQSLFDKCDEEFFKIVAETVDKQLNIYSLSENKQVSLKSFNEKSEETKRISIIFVEHKNYFIPLLLKKI